MSVHERWEEVLNPEILRDRLISASLYITAFEFLKDSIISRIKAAYVTGFDENGIRVDNRYETHVLSLHPKRSELYASLKWLKDNDVIDDADIQRFEKLKKARNDTAHELPGIVLGKKNVDYIERFQEVVELLNKIEIWWVLNIDIPANPDFDGREVDTDQIVPGPVAMIQLMLEVVAGNEELLKYYRAEKDGTMPNT